MGMGKAGRDLRQEGLSEHADFICGNSVWYAGNGVGRRCGEPRVTERKSCARRKNDPSTCCNSQRTEDGTLAFRKLGESPIDKGSGEKVRAPR